MNKSLFIIASFMGGALFSVLSHADEVDTNATRFVKLYAALCLKNINNLDALRNKLINEKLPRFQADQAALFLNGLVGDAWPISLQGTTGNFVLALPKGKQFCALFARRAHQSDVERRFIGIASSAPSPLISEKMIDKKSTTLPNGETHTISYSWSVPQAPRKLMLTLSTSVFENAQIQAMASAAGVRD